MKCPDCGKVPCFECGTCNCPIFLNEWINVKDDLPKIFELVWIYWRDREVLLGCRTAHESEPDECWYSIEDEKCRWTNWWRPYRIDKPLPPNV